MLSLSLSHTLSLTHTLSLSLAHNHVCTCKHAWNNTRAFVKSLDENARTHTPMAYIRSFRGLQHPHAICHAMPCPLATMGACVCVGGGMALRVGAFPRPYVERQVRALAGAALHCAAVVCGVVCGGK